MQTAKQEVEELLKQLPDDSTQDDINQGRTSGHGEAKERLKKWLGH